MFVLAMEFPRSCAAPRLRSTWQQISVAMAEGSHPFPFRTRKLSPPAPMVLGSRGPGRVGRRRVLTYEGPPAMGVLRRFGPTWYTTRMLINAFKLVVLERYAQFEGRAGRAEYWWFFLANLLISVGFSVLG